LEEQLNFISACSLQGKLHANQKNSLKQALEKQKQLLQEKEGLLLLCNRLTLT
jgi:hypothetical protein